MYQEANGHYESDPEFLCGDWGNLTEGQPSVQAHDSPLGVYQKAPE